MTDRADGVIVGKPAKSIRCGDCGWHVDATNEEEARAAAEEHEEIEHGGTGIDWVYIH